MSASDDVGALIARARAAQRSRRRLGPGSRRRARDGRRVGDRRAGAQPGAGRMRRARYRPRQRRRQDRQEPAQDDGPAARPRRRAYRRRDRGGSRARLVEIARPVGVVAAITPSTNPGATPANNIVNALKCRNAIVLAPSPKGASTLALLLRVRPRRARPHRRAARSRARAAVAGDARAHARADAAGRPRGRDRLAEQRARRLRERHARARRRRRQRRGDRRRDRRRRRRGAQDRALEDLRQRDELLVREQRHRGRGDRGRAAGGARARRRRAARRARKRGACSRTMFPRRRARAEVVAQSAAAIAALAGLIAARSSTRARFLSSRRTGVGPEHPFSGEKLSPVLALYRARDFAAARRAGASGCCAIRAPATRSACTRASPSARVRLGPDAAGLPRHRQPGALLRHRRQLRQRAAVLAVDGLRHVGRQQLLRQPQLPALPQHHARRASAAPDAREPYRGRALRRLSRSAARERVTSRRDLSRRDRGRTPRGRPMRRSCSRRKPMRR